MSVNLYFTGMHPETFWNEKSDQSSVSHCACDKRGTQRSSRKKTRSIDFIGFHWILGQAGKILTIFHKLKSAGAFYVSYLYAATFQT